MPWRSQLTVTLLPFSQRENPKTLYYPLRHQIVSFGSCSACCGSFNCWITTIPNDSKFLYKLRYTIIFANEGEPPKRALDFKLLFFLLDPHYCPRSSGRTEWFCSD